MNDSLADWHIKPPCWWGENKSKDAEDEVKRSPTRGAQHAWGNRGLFAQKILIHAKTVLVTVQVDVVKRLKLNKRRKRLPIIYHKITANKTYSTINLQMRVKLELDNLSVGTFIQVENPLNRLVILAKHGSMMLAGDCHFIQVLCQHSESSVGKMKWNFQVVNDVGARDADWVDWFIGVDKVQNRTGDWFFGVAALRNDVSWIHCMAFHHRTFIWLSSQAMFSQNLPLLSFITDSLLGLLFHHWEQLLCKP